MSKRGRASKGEEEEESHVSFAVNEDREEDVDASESMDMREMETQKLDVDGGDEEEESEAALSGGYGQLTNDEENDHQQQYIADEEDDIDVDALMEGADSSPTGSIPVVSFLNDEEEADLESRAQAESLIHEPAASPPNEKLKKIAIKRAMQRTTRAPSSFIVYSTKRRAELDSR